MLAASAGTTQGSSMHRKYFLPTTTLVLDVLSNILEERFQDMFSAAGTNNTFSSESVY